MTTRTCFLWLALLAVAFSGCSHPPKPMMIGIYDAPREALPELSAVGFNLVTLAPGETNRTAYLDTAQALTLGVILNPLLESASGRNETARLDKHPALRAWYLVDEPDLHFMAPGKVRERREKLRSVARKPAFLVVASGAAVEKYRASAELMAVDWYPIPWAPLATLSREMRSARLAAQGQEFLAIIQAFDWTAYPDLLVGSQGPLRPPTYEELRCMTFLALFQGAKGLLFYTYDSGPWKMQNHPETWEALTRVVSEVREKSVIFEERVDWWPNQTKYPAAAGEMYNEIKEGSIALNLFRVKPGNAEVPSGYYLVAINSSAREATFSFRLPFQGIESLESFGGTGEISMVNGWVTKRYAPFEVCFYGPVNGSLVLDRLP